MEAPFSPSADSPRPGEANTSGDTQGPAAEGLTASAPPELSHRPASSLRLVPADLTGPEKADAPSEPTNENDRLKERCLVVQYLTRLGEDAQRKNLRTLGTHLTYLAEEISSGAHLAESRTVPELAEDRARSSSPLSRRSKGG